MLRAALGGFVVLAGLGAAACTTSPVVGEELSAGCPPATTIWLPGVNGTPGRPMTVGGGSCLPESANLDIEAATQPDPPQLHDAATAIRNGVGHVCGGFLLSRGIRMDAMTRRAFEAGFGLAPHLVAVPRPDRLDQPQPSMLGFRASVAGEPPTGAAIVVLVGDRRDPTCQMQVRGYPAEAQTFVDGLERDGWRKSGAETRSDDVAASRFYGRLGETPATLVVNRWQNGEPPGGLSHIINLVTGENATRGALN